MAGSYRNFALLFLGPPRVLMDEEDATGSITAKHLGLVAYLASAAPEPQPRNRVAGIFWSEKSDEASRYRLRHALWELRRTVGDALLSSDHRSCWLCLDDGVKVDILDFKAGCALLDSGAAGIEDLRKAVDLYRGDLLDGLTVREAPLFDEWLLTERERLQLLYLEGLWQLSKAQTAAGDLDGAVQTLNRLVEADPLRERSYRAIMGVHLLQGDRTAALRVYERCAAVLQNELGVSPSPATEQVRQAACRDSNASVEADLERAHRLFGDGRSREAWSICSAIEATAGDPAIISQAVLLRAEIAIAEGRQSESLGLVRAARQALGRFAQSMRSGPGPG